MKVIIAGGRDFNNREVAFKCLDKRMWSKGDVIVSGHASGADALGEEYAKAHGLDIDLHPANWREYGRAAGPIRNREMAEVADKLIAFWDGKSRGTKNMISEAKEKGLCVVVYDYGGNRRKGKSDERD